MGSAIPNRIRRSYTQSINASPEEVFPLLCPVREMEWASGWNPSLVLSESGAAERDCVFTTSGTPADTIWVITRHDPKDLGLEMLMVTPDRTVGNLEISLSAGGDNNTVAEVAYTYTSIGPRGDEFLKGFTEEWYREFMQNWEADLNHFLSTGTKRSA